MHEVHYGGAIAKWWQKWKPTYRVPVTVWLKWLIKSNFYVTRSLNWVVNKAAHLHLPPARGVVA